MTPYLQRISKNILGLNKITFVVMIYLLTALFLPITSLAQSEEAPRQFSGQGGEASLGVARVIEIENKDVLDGHILSSSETGPVLSIIPYDSHVVGVVARDSAILISSTELVDGIPVISVGQVYLLVSSKDGPIVRGDLLTTSTIPGVAVKAIKSGYVLGTALEDYDNSDPENVEKIVADLNLHYFNAKPTFPGSLTDIFKFALLTTKEGPSAIFKYIIAAMVVLGSFILGFLSFGRTAAKGIEALGRNPAAKGIIHLGIIFNISIVIAIVLAGLTVAFLILRL